MSSFSKVEKTLEWYTEFPFANCPRESPTFFIQNVECYFYLCRKDRGYIYANTHGGYYYEIYLKLKTTQRRLNSFSLVIYSDFQSQGNFTRNCVQFSSSDQYLYSLNVNQITDRNAALCTGYFVRFCFVFELKDEDELLLHLKNKTDEKSIQADLLTSLQTDVEYLSIDFGELLKNGHHSDIQMLCNGGTIPVHKAVLAARSKVFSDMFQSNTEENKSGLINMTTTEKSVMELCLEFIYKGKIVNLPIEKASNLYVLGHVLKISSLTKVCADLMISNLSEDNYVTCLVLADKHKDDYLKCGVIDYISDHVYLLKAEG